MSIDSLKDVYIDQLQDIYSANSQALNATKKLVDAATDSELKKALQRGAEGIEEGKSIVSDIIKAHNENPTGEFCKGMEGLVKEVKAHVLEATFGDDAVRDAMIITQYQRMVHYALAAYGCVVAFAKRLDLQGDADKLYKCLDETYEGDREMSKIAEGDINKDADS